ncbi:MAG: hypothetical protein WAN11_24290 [Syntrophobacteraceae bacterium]
MKIFYSWQSDLPNKTNRSFIEEALKKAATSLCSDESIDINPVIDRDTAGIPGSPDIGQTILKKIDECDIFVADVSIINSEGGERPAPNPNVLIELGYALKAKGESRLIMVQNTVFGSPEKLPFDLRMKRVIAYEQKADDPERAPERKALAQKFESAIRIMIPEIERSREVLEPPEKAPSEKLLDIIHSPAERVRIEEIVMDEANRVYARIEAADPKELLAQFSEELFLSKVKEYEEAVSEFEKIFAVAGQWGEAHHENLWARALEIVGNPLEPATPWYDIWLNLRRYPALRAFYCCGILALYAGNYATLHAIFERPKIWRHENEEPFYLYVNFNVVMPNEAGKHLPGMKQRYVPASYYLHESLRPILKNALPNQRVYTKAFDCFEYFFSLVFAHLRLQNEKIHFWTPVGCYGWRQKDIVEQVFDEAKAAGNSWGPLVAGFFGGSYENFSKARTAVDEHLAKLSWY